MPFPTIFLAASRALITLLMLIGVSIALSRGFGPALGLGPLSQHMLDHIALLGLAAPAGAWTLRNHLPRVDGRTLAAVAAIQIALIWIWHLPPVFSAAHGAAVVHLAMTAVLYVSGLLFWCAIVGLSDRDRWQAILALLLTGKLFCLFAAVLVFSPRVLYNLTGAHAHHGGATDIADQQLAGLIMIAVCPLTYVAAGIAIATRWFVAIDTRHPEPPRAHLPIRSPMLALPLVILLAGCSEIQSTLAPASPEAGSAASLTWVLVIGATAIFAFVMGLLALAIFGNGAPRMALANHRAVVLGGIAFPAVVLFALLVYGLWIVSASATPTEEPQKIAVQGERWWWRVTYKAPDARALASANEIRVEVGRPVRLMLTSPDVIHSFWVPAVGGKVDLIPGRTNELRFTATKAGTFRGQCAEYCGGPHAMMALRIVAMEPEDYAEWLTRERKSASALAPKETAIKRGQELFMTNCVACHTVRGTRAGGRLGPDLTHVASRGTIGGEILPMSKANIARWLVQNQHLKPNNLMPEYSHLPGDDLDALSTYIASLK